MTAGGAGAAASATGCSVRPGRRSVRAPEAGARFSRPFSGPGQRGSGLAATSEASSAARGQWAGGRPDGGDGGAWVQPGRPARARPPRANPRRPPLRPAWGDCAEPMAALAASARPRRGLRPAAAGAGTQQPQAGSLHPTLGSGAGERHRRARPERPFVPAGRGDPRRALRAAEAQGPDPEPRSTPLAATPTPMPRGAHVCRCRAMGGAAGIPAPGETGSAVLTDTLQD